MACPFLSDFSTRDHCHVNYIWLSVCLTRVYRHVIDLVSIMTFKMILFYNVY